MAAAKADCIVSANFCPEFCQPDYAFFTNSKRFEKLDLAALPCPVVLTSNLRPLPQGALAVNYDRLATPDVQNASLGSNSVLMLLRLLRLSQQNMELIRCNNLTERHARALLRLNDEATASTSPIISSSMS